MTNQELQHALNTHGFPCGAEDGNIGPATKSAVSLFQAAFCGPGGWLDIDGIPGPRTQEALSWTVQNNALVSYFSIPEVACHHCGKAYVKRELLSSLFKLRQAVGAVVIVDAYRCVQHNAQIGGASNSQHIYGTAADPTNISIAELLPVKAFTAIGTPDHRRATHIDVRSGNVNNPLIFADASKG